MPDITESKILIIATDGFEQSELQEPLTQLRKQGAVVHVASPVKTKQEGQICGWKDGDWGSFIPVDKTIDTLSAKDYDALIIPGGVINPDKLRTDAKAIALIKAFDDAGKPIAAICHGPWLLAESGVAKGRRLTSVGSIKTDLINAGGVWEDSEVVTHNGIITSRTPEDLPAFINKIIEEVAEARHGRRAA